MCRTVFTLERGERIENTGLPFPLIVKPQFGDGSDEIGKDSLVRTLRELRERVKAIRSRLKDPCCAKNSFRAAISMSAIVGNEPRVLAPTEMVVGAKKPRRRNLQPIA